MKKFRDYTIDIQNSKSDFESPIGGILKYIKLEDNYVNQDFFKGKEKINQNDIDVLLKTFDEKLDYIKSSKNEVLNSDLFKIEKNFLLNSLNTSGLKYILFKSSIYFEAEKSGFKLSNKKRIELLSRVNRLQDSIYGPEISKNDIEKKEILDNLFFLYSKNKLKLTSIEESLYLKLLSNLGYDFNSNTSNDIKKNNSNSEFPNLILSNDKIVLLFEMVLDLYGLTNWSVILDPLVGNFSINNEKIQIILPKENLKTYSLERLLKLFDHEIGVHIIRGNNTYVTLKTSGDGYLEAEEGFATLTEELFDKKIKDLQTQPTEHHITTFIAENFDGENTKRFLELYYKLKMDSSISFDSISKLSNDRMLRVKRFVSLNEKGANRKDVSYTRGQNQIVDFFQNSNIDESSKFIKDFYFSKLAFEDISLINEFRECLNINQNELKYPLWIGKIIYKKLSGKKIFLSSLQEEDFRFKIIEKLSIDVKRKIVKILKELN